MKLSNERERGPLKEGTPAANEEVSKRKEQVQNMQLEIDILKETLDVFKKDPGVDRSTLKNREKAAIIDALKNEYPLPTLLKALCYARSSYFYRKKAEKQRDLYTKEKEQIRVIFEENYSCYGYRRIYLQRKKKGVRLSEKVIRRLMKQELLQPRISKKQVYSAYQGEITPAVPNVIQRNFYADHPNEKWLTDSTEFLIPAGKVYLSPMIDCYDGMPISWRVGLSPNGALVNGMLDDAIGKLNTREKPTFHTDRGCHYRFLGWTQRMNQAQLQRSMSKKGCSPDNSACEGFFGRMKNEMFYGRSWMDISTQ